MRRSTRTLVHKKGNKVKTVSKAPLSTDGNDGDILIHTSANGGAFLYAKAQGRWFKFSPVSNTIDGWHGSRKIIKITNCDVNNGPGSVGDLVHQTTSAYVNSSNTDHWLTIHCHIPKGFIATGIYLQLGEILGGQPSNPPRFKVSQEPVNVQTLGAPGTTLIDFIDMTDTEHFFTSLVGSDKTILCVTIREFRGMSATYPRHLFYGGYVKIQPVLTAERQFTEGLDEISILERSSGE